MHAIQCDSNRKDMMIFATLRAAYETAMRISHCLNRRRLVISRESLTSLNTLKVRITCSVSRLAVVDVPTIMSAISRTDAASARKSMASHPFAR